ncbi:vacuolar membrane protein [Cyathus striatus]|nr:vacuolar membrane protein [Cyathus striatus]
MASTLAANAIPPNAPAAPGTRQFVFFDSVPVKDVQDLNSPPDIFKAAPEISTTCSSSFGILVADIHGSVHLLNSDFESVNSWIAHVSGRVTHMMERRGVLVTLGEEASTHSPLLKIWDLENKEPRTGSPVLLRSTKIQLGHRPHPVTTVALTSNLSHLAIGLGDGTVLLYRHLDQSLTSSNSLTALPKVRTVHESPTEPITGLGFREPLSGSAMEHADETAPSTNSNDDAIAKNLYLFVVTTNRVLCYQASGRGSGGIATEVDEVGCGLGCATMDWRGREMIVARDEAIYKCGTEGRGTCYAYEGPKSSIRSHLNYLVIVSPPFAPSSSNPSATVRNFVARTSDTGSEISKVTIFDLENKYVAYTGTFRQGVKDVVSQWGKVYVLCNDGNLIALEEKSTKEKLDLLYSKAAYTIALNLAKTQQLDEASVADIHRQYGDHLYAKGDYDPAMSQFVKTIGWLQPSYVIRKFLDAQRIHNLVTYLQELHSLGLANADHTTLLLNTYTKLKDIQRLDSFIKTESKRDSDELPFDLDTAIRVCRQAGYFEHAGYLARKYERHEDYLRIQIEDAGEFGEALSYLRKLGPEAAESNLARYGRAMLQSLPEETTQLLIDLCTDSGSLEAETSEQPASHTKQLSTTSYLSILALNRAPTLAYSETATIPAAPSIKTVKPETASIKTTKPDVTRRDSLHEGSGSSTPSSAQPPASASIFKAPLPPKFKILSPRLYFAHFVDHMEQFVNFLETVAYRRWKQTVEDRPEGAIGTWHGASDNAILDGDDKADQVAVWNTLLELYLTLPGPKEKGKNKEDRTPIFDEGKMRDKAMRVLRSADIPYDPTHALILCSTHGYTRGLVLLWEKLGMYEEVLRFWIDRDKEGEEGASAKVIEALMLYGSDHPQLYPLVLRFLTSTTELLERHKEDLKGILEHIDEENIMPPIGVVQVLSRNSVASVGLVKEWLMRRIRQARNEIENELANPDLPKVSHNTRCAACQGQLDLPSVHFMCKHSYHQRCVAENETECPNCAREHGVIRDIRRNNLRLADQHDIFLSEVQENGFEAIAASFGRGLLNVPRPLDEIS